MSLVSDLLDNPEEVKKDKVITTSTDLTLREYVDFLQACQMSDDDPKEVIGKAIRTYTITVEARLSSKKS